MIIIIMIIIFEVIFSFIPSKCTFALSSLLPFARSLYVVLFRIVFFILSIVYTERRTIWMIHQTKSTIEDRIHQSNTELLISIFFSHALICAHNIQKRCWCTLLMLNVFEIERIVLNKERKKCVLVDVKTYYLAGNNHQISPKRNRCRGKNMNAYIFQ